MVFIHDYNHPDEKWRRPEYYEAEKYLQRMDGIFTMYKFKIKFEIGTDKNSCWYHHSCIDEMNRFYDLHKNNADIKKHFSVFTELLDITHSKGSSLLDLGCGTAMLSEYCKEYGYVGADLPHIINGCAIRNYPNPPYKFCNIEEEELSWINHDIIVLNGVIDIMKNPLEILKKILSSAKNYVIIHRQEITEERKTYSMKTDSYGGYTWHSIINRKDFNSLLETYNFEIIKELPLYFSNWENNGSSFLLKKI